MRGTLVGKRVHVYFNDGVLDLLESGATVRVFKYLFVKLKGGLEPRLMIKTISDARVRRQIEAALEVGSSTSPTADKQCLMLAKVSTALGRSPLAKTSSTTFPPVDFLVVCLVYAIDNLRNCRRPKGSSTGYILFYFENSINICDI